MDEFPIFEAAERKKKLELMADGLKISMGKRYVDVALRCLRILDSGHNIY
jgi:hypothetical protein